MDEKKKKGAERRMLLLMVAALCILTMTGAWAQDRTRESTADPACTQPVANILTVGASEGIANEYPGIVRFHVIANSDSQKDQNLKYMVRNSVFSKLENRLTSELLRAEADGVTDALKGAFGGDRELGTGLPACPRLRLSGEGRIRYLRDTGKDLR